MNRELSNKATLKQKERKQVVLEKLDELIPKIKEEVTKSMIIDKLNQPTDIKI